MNVSHGKETPGLTQNSVEGLDVLSGSSGSWRASLGRVRSGCCLHGPTTDKL